ncbi:hypothetical protein QQF64_031349 [Cirrhinus molitorella]|uniref:Uncharacterized protein n=1 Tax=Cirrhinus molitorella TaxID=172907 RepID=A0ABR3MWN9_9TELE
MTAVFPIVREHMEKAQREQQATYNRPAQPREFQTEDKELVLIPTAESTFLATWQGPFEVAERIGEVNHRVTQPEVLYSTYGCIRDPDLAMATLMPSHNEMLSTPSFHNHKSQSREGGCVAFVRGCVIEGSVNLLCSLCYCTLLGECLHLVLMSHVLAQQGNAAECRGGGASWKKKVALNEAQEELQLPKHALITECPTRWGSRQWMIEWILEQQKALSQILSADCKTRHLVPQWQDTDVLESVSRALKPLQEFTDALHGEDYVSVSYLKPVLHLFNTKILAADDEDSDLTKTIKSKILEYISKNYDGEDTQELLDMASFLDPRFMTNYIAADKLPNIKAKVMSDIKEISQTDAVNFESTTGRKNVDTDCCSHASISAT